MGVMCNDFIKGEMYFVCLCVVDFVVVDCDVKWKFDLVIVLVGVEFIRCYGDGCKCG